MSANKTRADDQTVLGVSMPKTLKARILKLADGERRSMAQWSVMQLERIVAELETQQAAALSAKPPAAENARQPDPIDYRGREPVKKPNRHSSRH